MNCQPPTVSVVSLSGQTVVSESESPFLSIHARLRATCFHSSLGCRRAGATVGAEAYKTAPVGATRHEECR